MSKVEIFELAGKLISQMGKVERYAPYNVFTAWKMSENDHTKMLLALLRYKDANGRYALLNSFLSKFTKGRDKMIHYQNLSDVCIRFNPRYDKDDRHSFIDGLVTFTAKRKRIAVILENKIYDAPDQKDQVRRYITHMIHNENVALENVWVFYITGNGTKEIEGISYNPEGEPESTNIGPRFVNINYQADILSWLKTDVLDLRIYPEALTIVIRAYVESLEKDVFGEDANSTQLKKWLCKQLGVNTNLTKLTELDIERLYSFMDDVQDIRKKRENCGDDDLDAVDCLFGIIKDVIQDVEKLAFGTFERLSMDILNNQWMRKMRKIKGARWTAKHRGIKGDNGFVQLGIDVRWDTVHLEWENISVKKMFMGKNYKIGLHVEDDKQLAEQWQKHLAENTILIPANCKKGNKETSRILHYEIQTAKPIAKMSEEEMSMFLKRIYTEDLNYCCRMLVER